MTTETQRISGGLGGWIGHLVDSAGAIPGHYGRLFAKNRRKTIGLTVLAILAVTYPVINQTFLAPFSRNVFELPVPDDTTVTFCPAVPDALTSAFALAMSGADQCVPGFFVYGQ